MPKAIYNHTHTYRRVEWGKNKYVIYRCMEPTCTHYLPSHAILSKPTKCYACGAVFLITQDMISRKTMKLRCEECKKSLYNREEKED